MMTPAFDNLFAAHRAMLETAAQAGLKSLEGAERLISLNLQATRQAMEEAADNARSAFDGQAPGRFAQMASTGAQPATERANAYAKQVYRIATETGSAIADTLQSHVKGAQTQAAEWVDQAARTAPAGSEPLFAAARNALNVARTSYEQALSASQKFAEYAEAGVERAATAAAAATGGKKSA